MSCYYRRRGRDVPAARRPPPPRYWSSSSTYGRHRRCRRAHPALNRSACRAPPGWWPSRRRVPEEPAPSRRWHAVDEDRCPGARVPACRHASAHVASDLIAGRAGPRSVADTVAGVDRIWVLGAEVGAPYGATPASGCSERLAVGIGAGETTKIAALAQSDAGHKEGHRLRRRRASACTRSLRARWRGLLSRDDHRDPQSSGGNCTAQCPNSSHDFSSSTRRHA
jgi:hypothetical protein